MQTPDRQLMSMEVQASGVRVAGLTASRTIVSERDDPNLAYLDGTSLYGEDDAVELPLPDALHPDTETHQIIGTRFAQHAFSTGGPLSA